MKSAVVGLILGSLLGCIAAAFYLPSLWLPLTAASLLLCGSLGKAFKVRVVPSLVLAVISIIAYLVVYWLQPEYLSRSAETGPEHYEAGSVMRKRADLFGNNQRAYEHYEKSAELDYAKGVSLMGAYYDYGFAPVKRDRRKAIEYYSRASTLGNVGAKERLADLRKTKTAEQSVPPKSDRAGG